MISNENYCVTAAQCTSIGWYTFQDRYCYENCPSGTFSNSTDTLHCSVCNPPCSNEFELINSETIFDASTRIEFDY